MKSLMRFRLPPLLGIATIALASMLSTPARAADHGDGPTVAGDQACDLADLYVFVDPVTPSKIVFMTTVRGFIVPGEAGNFAIFDPGVRFRFQIENTGPVDERGKPLPNPGPTDLDFDPAPDAFVDVQFSPKTSSAPQVATVTFSGSAFAELPKGKFVGNATAAGLGPTPPVLPGQVSYFPSPAQKLKAAGRKASDPPGDEIPVEFFAGEVDDPFFFDVPGFVRFRDRYLANLQNTAAFPTRVSALTDAAAELARGRDTFAGYNAMVVAFRMDISLLKSKVANVKNTTKFGINILAQRKIEKSVRGAKISIGGVGTVDRMGIPGVNALLVPLDQKNAYNGGTTVEDAKGKNAAGLVATLTALQVQGDIANPATPLGLLAKLVVADGDFLRIDTSIQPNDPLAHFPNGRRLEDDVVKTLLSVIASNVLPPDITADDSVTQNDVPLTGTFPYLGLPQQPRDSGVVDDLTRN